MYAKISTFQVKPDQLAAFDAAIVIASEQLKKVPGMIECKSAIDAEGVGVCFAVAGVSQLYGLQLNKSPISVWLVPSLLILAALASAWQHRSGM